MELCANMIGILPFLTVVSLEILLELGLSLVQEIFSILFLTHESTEDESLVSFMMQNMNALWIIADMGMSDFLLAAISMLKAYCLIEYEKKFIVLKDASNQKHTNVFNKMSTVMLIHSWGKLEFFMQTYE